MGDAAIDTTTQASAAPPRAMKAASPVSPIRARWPAASAMPGEAPRQVC
jgi:hypothetical protein